MTESAQGIDEIAAGWAVRLHAGPLGPAEQSELEAWLATNLRHRGALVRAQAAWMDLDRLGALVNPIALNSVASPRQPSGELTIEAPLLKGQPDGTRRWLVAAGLAALTVAGTGVWWRRGQRGEVYESDVGEIRRVALPDGSHMVLNTATEAAVRFDAHRRDVQLTHGEGLFEVAKDAARPFVVHVGAVAVRAVGTVFVVRAVGERVEVTVTEGIVELSNSGSRNSPHRVSANEQAVVEPSQILTVRSLSSAQAERRLAWREGLLDLDGESLGDAVSEMNRHNHRHIMVEDATLAARPVVGRFRTNDPEGFAATVAIALGAETRDQGELIRLLPQSHP